MEETSLILIEGQEDSHLLTKEREQRLCLSRGKLSPEKSLKEQIIPIRQILDQNLGAPHCGVAPQVVSWM